jgi:cytoskeletal protein CcmA (bactofilin family)
MFHSKSAARNKAPESVSMIGAGTTITGDIVCTGDIRIDGTLKGNLYCQARVLIGASGKVEGHIQCRSGDITGTVTGNIQSSDLLYLHGEACVDGDIQAAKLQVDPTVSFNGQCRMGANIVEMNNSLPQAVNE